jgi:predicted AAA+ superfamily ATPase
MAITNHERVGKTLELLREGLGPFVERELRAKYGEDWAVEVKDVLTDTRLGGRDKDSLNDVAAILVLMDRKWGDVFRRILGKAERSLVNELLDIRNKWAHQEAFSSDDTYRSLDSACRLLSAVSAPEAAQIDKVKMELLRVRFDEQMRSEKRKSAGTAIETQATGNLKPWREVVTPHKDVASGKYQQAEFAADLWQVHMGEGTDEYRDPVEFFRRTYLTESLKGLLVGAVNRVCGESGDPVVQLQTNFGGGKTHSMLALYHLFSGVSPNDLLGVDVLLEEAAVTELPSVNRVVLVGNKISPGNPATKEDGTVVRTLWGELAWQLGYAAGGKKEAKKAFDRIRPDDEKATSPGDALRHLFNDYGPCLILIDEWVAYARQLHDEGDLPAGGFETQFSFAQVLTESAKLAGNCLLVISLPASDTSASPRAQADDVEVGGVRGREALDRLRNVVGRLESSWRPASAEEGFEIVRRRLFEPLITQDQFKARDLVAREFFDMYRSQQQEFPPECRSPEYEKRLKDAYPIHPEVFDRLYEDWSTLVKFQRTRGVLRLMAAVIHSLWQKGDRNPLILPANIPIDDPRVQFELTRYLPDVWVPVIEKDVDGPHSLPLQLDGELPNLGKFHAARRVARAIYLGSAPTQSAANRGVEDRRVKLGCVMPGETPAVFGDALRRLAGSATYLYQDGPRYWYSTQPTVTKLADDRSEQLKRDTDKVTEELVGRIRADLRHSADFSKVHCIPQSGHDIPDETDARLVVLGADSSHSKDTDSAALKAAKEMLESRGNSPRLYRNTLVFLVADKSRLQDLDEALRKYLAWTSIVNEKDTLNLDPHQAKQAETQRKSANSDVSARLPETYQWLLIPVQSSPQSEVEWQAARLSGLDSLAARAAKKLKNDELLVPTLAGTRLRMELDRIPLWRGDSVSVQQLKEDFARYCYLPRLSDSSTLRRSIEDGVALITWESEAFAYADSFDEAKSRYRGLRGGQRVMVADSGAVVKPDVARSQMDADTGQTTGEHPILPDGGEATDKSGKVGTGATAGGTVGVESPAGPKRFYGSAKLDPVRAKLSFSEIVDEVVEHFTSQHTSNVRISIEIEVDSELGFSEHVVRTVRENCIHLKFGSAEFEDE